MEYNDIIKYIYYYDPYLNEEALSKILIIIIILIFS